MSYRKKLGKIITDFLEVDTKWKYFRDKPTDKQRKYKNIEISQDFKRLDEQRKKQRFQNIKKRKQLLQYKMQQDYKLLTASEQQIISNEFKELSKIIEENKNQIMELSDKIDELQPNYILIQGHIKLVVMNQIRNIQYNSDHNPGYVLHPESAKIIENIHYCVNHNLPVNRIKLYQLMPNYFQAQIGELEESVQKLIQQKKIYDEDDTAAIKFFYRVKDKNQDDQIDQYDLVDEIDNNRRRMTQHFMEILSGHNQFLKKVVLGQTPFRNIDHLHYILLSEMPIKLLPEEQRYKEDLQYIMQVKDSFNQYSDEVYKQIHEMKYSYKQPPVFVARNPILMKRWDEMMENHMNPIPIQQFLPEGDQTENKLRDRLQQKMREHIRQKYDPIFIEMMNTDRSQINNKKLQIQFLNFSTTFLQQLKALPEFSQNPQAIEQQLFKKIEHKQPFLLSRRHPLIKLDELTRILYLNKKDKVKYNLKFFAKWFNIDEELLKDALNSFSYLKAETSKQMTEDEKAKKDAFKYEIIKFEM